MQLEHVDWLPALEEELNRALRRSLDLAVTRITRQPSVRRGIAGDTCRAACRSRDGRRR
jgi:hypothetical protein